MPSYSPQASRRGDQVTNYVSLAPVAGFGRGVDELVSRFFIHRPAPRTSGCRSARLRPDDARIGVPGQRLWAVGSPYVKGINYTNISTRYDGSSSPTSAGNCQLSAPARTCATSWSRTCASDYSDHLAIAGSRRAAHMVLNALDPQRHRGAVRIRATALRLSVWMTRRSVESVNCRGAGLGRLVAHALPARWWVPGSDSRHGRSASATRRRRPSASLSRPPGPCWCPPRCPARLLVGHAVGRQPFAPRVRAAVSTLLRYGVEYEAWL